LAIARIFFTGFERLEFFLQKCIVPGRLLEIIFRAKMPVCGPKYSLCCTILSVWAIIQLTLMGIFFHINSVALIEDISLEEVSPTLVNSFKICFEDAEQSF
jgi:hypothetical protein